jgi:uncharacterized protein YjiS (DUF1127 family)
MQISGVRRPYGNGNPTALAPSGWLARLRAVRGARRSRNAKIRQIAEELNRMTAAELAELGLFHCDIPQIARSSVRAS